MKDKFIDLIFNIIMILLSALVIIAAIALVISYHLGVPYAVYVLTGKEYSYTFFLAVWFCMYFNINVIRNMKLKKKLKQYQEIDDIMKGRFK